MSEKTKEIIAFVLLILMIVVAVVLVNRASNPDRIAERAEEYENCVLAQTGMTVVEFYKLNNEMPKCL